MQPKLVNRDPSAWEKGDLAYELEDTLEIGIIKAVKEGMKPGANDYAAFITAFGRRMRSKQISPNRKKDQESGKAAPAATAVTSAVILRADFARNATAASE